MCYNVEYLERRVEKYAERYRNALPDIDPHKTLPGELPLYYFVSGFDHPLLPIVKHDGIFLFEWGLIPHWVKDLRSAEDIRNKTLNAAGETVFDKPSFRSSIRSRRCLLGIHGFYEWREFAGKKYPYLVRLRDKELFSLGCLYDTWTDRESGEVRHTFGVITTAANPLLEKIHNVKKRMPLIIARGDEKRWIDPALPENEVRALIRPFGVKDMEAYTISREANSPRNPRNHPGIIAPVGYPELD